MVATTPKVLFVEDDPISQFVHKRMLKRLNCEVDIVSNGLDALSLFQKGYDIVFIDLGLPDKHGTQLIDEMKQLNQDSTLRLFVLTANQDDNLREACLKAGAESVIYKPTSVEALESLLFVC